MGKNSHRICEIMKCHQSAKKLYSSSIISLNNNKWKVKSLEYAKHTLYNRKLLQRFDCKLCVMTIKYVHLLTHVYTC